MTDITEEQEAMLVAWWDSYSSVRSEVRNLFGDWKSRSLTGDHQTVYQEIESFASMDTNAFYVLMLTLQDIDDFFSDVEAAVGPEAREEFESLYDEYGEVLGETFRVVYQAEVRDYKNTVTDTTFSLYRPIGGTTPIIEFLIYSGNITVAEMRADPQHFIDLAHSMTEAVDDSVEQIMEEDTLISEINISEMRDFHHALSEVVSDLDEKIETLEA